MHQVYRPSAPTPGLVLLHGGAKYNCCARPVHPQSLPLQKKNDWVLSCAFLHTSAVAKTNWLVLTLRILHALYIPLQKHLTGFNLAPFTCTCLPLSVVAKHLTSDWFWLLLIHQQRFLAFYMPCTARTSIWLVLFPRLFYVPLWHCKNSLTGFNLAPVRWQPVAYRTHRQQ